MCKGWQSRRCMIVEVKGRGEGVCAACGDGRGDQKEEVGKEG